LAKLVVIENQLLKRLAKPVEENQKMLTEESKKEEV